MSTSVLRHMAPYLAALSLAAGTSIWPGCGDGRSGDGQRSDPSGMTFTVSIPPQAYLLERIAGPDVRVITLVEGGESPATYQPSDLQVSEVMRSRVYFRVGVPFEQGRWLDAINDSGSAIQVVDLREGVPMRALGDESQGDVESGDQGPGQGEGGNSQGEDARGRGEQHPGEDARSNGEHVHSHACSHSGLDPHIWLSTENLKTMARTMTRTLSEIDPERSGQYQANLEALVSELDILYDELREILSPFAGRRLYLYHPAWGYFCDAFGLEQVAIELEGKEPSDEELTRLQERMRADRARVVFVQPQIAGRSVRPVARAVGAEVRTLDPLARNVVQNLRSAAKAIAESYR